MRRILFAFHIGMAAATVGTANAAASADCRERVERTEGVQIQVLWSEGSHSCWVNISPLDTTDLIYRSFLLGSDGLLMVFNSFGDGPSSKFTGAREFYLFPRRAMTDFSIVAEGNVRVKTASGAIAEFDSRKGRFVSLSGSKIDEAVAIDPSNEGGLEIPEYDGVLLDLGFTLGRSPVERADANSKFRDRTGRECVVSNKEVFDYPDNPFGEIGLKHETDAKLADFLKKRCPGLDTAPLLAN